MVDFVHTTSADAGKVLGVLNNGDYGLLDVSYTLNVTAVTQDSVTVTGQTVTVRSGGAEGNVYATASYNGQPVSFNVPDGFDYYVSITSTIPQHFNPTTASGIIRGADASVTLTYSDFGNIRTFQDLKTALDTDMDLTGIVGCQVTSTRNNAALIWDVADYDATNRTCTLLLHDALPDNMQFEPPQALMWCENGLAAGDYKFKNGNTYYYFTLTSAIPSGGQLRATESAFTTFESTSATMSLETGTVSTTELSGATDLGTCGSGVLNHMTRVNYGSNNFAECALLQWLNSDAASGTPVTRITKLSRPASYSVAGFLAGWSSSDLACLDDAVWLCSANTVYECPAALGGVTTVNTPYTVTKKIGLVSEKEIFGTYQWVDAGDTQFDLYVGSENADRIKYYNNSARDWWLRSPYGGYAYFEHYVRASGDAYSSYAYYTNGVVPACKISKSA